MDPLDVVEQGYEEFRNSKGNKSGIGVLADNVTLTDYDVPGPLTKSPRDAVADYLVNKLWSEVFNPDKTDIVAEPRFTELPGGVVACLNVMGPHAGQDQHLCVDLVTVSNDKVTNIECCVMRHPLPSPPATGTSA